MAAFRGALCTVMLWQGAVGAETQHLKHDRIAVEVSADGTMKTLEAKAETAAVTPEDLIIRPPDSGKSEPGISMQDEAENEDNPLVLARKHELVGRFEKQVSKTSVPHSLTEAFSPNHAGLATVAASGSAVPQQLLALAHGQGECGVSLPCEQCAGKAKNMYCSFHAAKNNAHHDKPLYECKDICTVETDELRDGVGVPCFVTANISFQLVREFHGGCGSARSMTTHAVLGGVAVVASALVFSVNELA